jgi:flagellar hook-basal body complex protein FliE
MENKEEDDFEEKINIILRQTNYTKDEAREKLDMFENNEIKVIHDYMGIAEKKTPQKSLNQEIYRQIRNKLDDSMKDYNKKIQAKLLQELDSR